jgi:hypothetical protein
MESQPCEQAACPLVPTTPPVQPSTLPTRRPAHLTDTPCACGCTYILHAKEEGGRARDLTTRQIDVTSGDTLLRIFNDPLLRIFDDTLFGIFVDLCVLTV